MPGRTPYNSLNEAARAALEAAAAAGDPRHEWAGILYELEGKHYFSEPQTSGGSHSFDIKAGIPRPGRLAGIYHTHPGGPDERAHLFSAADIDVAKRMGVPSYIIHGEGEIKRYVHGETPMRRDNRVGRFRSDSVYSEGEVVRFPKMSVGESTVNRILNLADEINEEATTP